MNTLKNKVSLVGRLGAEPEVFTFENGKSLARFNLATNENYKGKDGQWHEVTQWHTVNAWGRIAERVKKALSKGQEVIVEGKLVHQNYESKTGEKRFNTVIEASEFLILSPKNEATNDASTKSAKPKK